jgi:hypothetical protein
MTGHAAPEAVPEAVDRLLASCSPEVRELALATRRLVLEVVPDAVEEVDERSRLLGFAFIPGTYRGLVTAITVHRSHVNLMFGRGVELLPLDATGLLDGSGKQARHVTVRTPGQLADPAVRELIEAAAVRTPRAAS